MDFQKLARIFFKVFAVSIFTYQMLNALQKFITVSTIPSSEIINIEDAPMPVILICELGQYDLLRAEYYGYDSSYNVEDFIFGDIPVENSFWWGGSESISFQELTKQIFRPMEEDNIPPYTEPKNFFSIKNGFCRQIDPTPLMLAETFSIDFGPGSHSTSKNVQYQIHIVDPGTQKYYMIDTESFSGDTIVQERYKYKHYSIQLEEIRWNKATKECMDYGPENEHKTQKDCLMNQHKQIFQPVLGCQVPWLSAYNSSEQCQGTITLTPTEYSVVKENLKKIYDATKYKAAKNKNCLPPCTQVRVSSRLTDSNDYYMYSQKLFLKFDKSVKKTTHVKAYGPFDLVVEVGSCLGLWIGWSALDVVDLPVAALQAIQRKLLAKRIISR